MKFLDQIRKPNHTPIKRQILLSFLILTAGVLLGVFQKYLDISQAELPPFLMKLDGLLDLHNFFGELAPWLVTAVCIAVFSCSPVWAGVKVLSFFTGMVTSYYLYSYYIGGFFPKNYAMIWGALTAVSPFLAYVCWYAKGKGWLSHLISAVILACLFNTTFAYGLWYFDIRSCLNLLMLLSGIIILYKNPKETGLELALSLPAALLQNFI